MAKQDAHKIQEALNLLNEAARDQKDEIGDLLSDKYQALREIIQGVEDEAVNKARHSAERLGELKEAAAEQAKATASRVDQKVHEDPWKTLGLPILGAFAMGFLLGRKD